MSDTALALEPAADRGDLGEVLAQWDRWVWRLARRYAQTRRADAEDVRSVILLTAVRMWPRYDPARGGAGTWLTFVARHALGGLTKQRRRTVRTVSPVPGRPTRRDDDTYTQTPDPAAPDPAELIDRADLCGRVRDAVAGLPSRERAAVRARFFGEATSREAGCDALAAGLALLRDRLPPPT